MPLDITILINQVRPIQQLKIMSIYQTLGFFARNVYLAIEKFLAMIPNNNLFIILLLDVKKLKIVDRPLGLIIALIVIMVICGSIVKE